MQTVCSAHQQEQQPDKSEPKGHPCTHQNETEARGHSHVSLLLGKRQLRQLGWPRHTRGEQELAFREGEPRRSPCGSCLPIHVHGRHTNIPPMCYTQKEPVNNATSICRCNFVSRRGGPPETKKTINLFHRILIIPRPLNHAGAPLWASDRLYRPKTTLPKTQSAEKRGEDNPGDKTLAGRKTICCQDRYPPAKQWPDV